MSDLLRFYVTKRGFNQVLNGLQYYMDWCRDSDCSDVKHAFDDIASYSILKSDDFDHETGEVYTVSVSCTQRTMMMVWTVSDWFGSAARNNDYQVDYTAGLVDKYWAYIKARDEERAAREAALEAERKRREAEAKAKAEARENLYAEIRDRWSAWCADESRIQTKAAFAREYEYDYKVVLAALRG